MALYVETKNQTLLWNTINKLPSFSIIPMAQKEIQFKNGIALFYQKYQNYPLTKNDLQKVNQETISYFVNRFSQPQQIMQNPNPQNINFVETKEEKYAREFKERQLYYDQMNSKPKLPSADIFLEKETDSAITNMDELIERYQQEREKDIGITANPYLVASSSLPVPSLDLTNVKKEERPKRKLRIETETISEPLHIQDLGDTKISWSDPLINNDTITTNIPKNTTNKPSILKESSTYNLQKTVELLEQRILSLENKMQEILEKMKTEENKIIDSALP